MQKVDRNRRILIIIIMLLMLGALVYKLWDKTIQNGAYWREIADNKRIKTIQITAPRGNIYDKNGILLAGTRYSYAVQGFKDDINRLSPEKRNNTLLTLIKYIERDGVDYVQDFPVIESVFTYATDEEYLNESELPTQKVINLLINNNLIAEYFSLVYVDPKDSDYKLSMGLRALNALKYKGVLLPISCDETKNFELFYNSDAELKKSIDNGDVLSGETPIKTLTRLASNDKSILERVLDHPVARKLAYELLKKYSLTQNVILSDLKLDADILYIENKAKLHRIFPSITKDSSAKSDFITITKDKSLPNFFSSVGVSKDNAVNIPAKELIAELENKGIKTNLVCNVSADSSSVEIKYEKEENSKENPIDKLIRLGKENKLIDNLIVDDRFKKIAEQANFKNSIYPRISIKDWKYGTEIDKEDLLKRYKIIDKKGKRLVGNGQNDAELVLNNILEKYNLNKDSSKYINYAVANLYYRISSQGNFAYAPINIAFELSDRTVARISENIPENTGISISKEPIRYYPHGTLAAHILGYIGKISSEKEIQKYVDEKKYNPTDLIGKTGIEESFESTLRGTNGVKTVLIDSKGNRTETIDEVEPKAGNNVYLSIDAKVQEVSEKQLAQSLNSIKTGTVYHGLYGDTKNEAHPTTNAGATVSVDTENGSIIAMASYPSYNPNLFVTGISSSDWKTLIPTDDSDPYALRPLLNIATQSPIQPGSTFKTITALTALEKGMDPNMKLYCSGHMEVGDTTFNCLIWTLHHREHGPLNMVDAIKVSCNYYFYLLGLGYDPNGKSASPVKVTVNDLQNMTEKLGMDKPTGIEINVPSESGGSIPSATTKLKIISSRLKKYLNSNLKNYLKENINKNENDFSKDVDTILSWVEQGKAKTRSSIIKDMELMGYDTNKILNGSKAGIVDIIKYSYINQAEWKEADSLNVVIGQGQNAYTPIQMANLATTLSTNGKKYKLTLIKEIRTHDNKTILYSQKPNFEQLKFNYSNSISVVQQGMRAAASYGSTNRVFSALPFNIACKTGTAQRGGKDPKTGQDFDTYAWMIGYAPYENPKIATCIVQYQAGYGTSNAPLFRDIVGTYLGAPAVNNSSVNINISNDEAGDHEH